MSEDGQKLATGSIKSKVLNGERPPIPEGFRETSHRIVRVIEMCWTQEASARPDFTAIKDQLS